MTSLWTALSASNCIALALFLRNRYRKDVLDGIDAVSVQRQWLLRAEDYREQCFACLTEFKEKSNGAEAGTRCVYEVT